MKLPQESFAALRGPKARVEYVAAAEKPEILRQTEMLQISEFQNSWDEISILSH